MKLIKPLPGNRAQLPIVGEATRRQAREEQERLEQEKAAALKKRLEEDRQAAQKNQLTGSSGDDLEKGPGYARSIGNPRRDHLPVSGESSSEVSDIKARPDFGHMSKSQSNPSLGTFKDQLIPGTNERRKECPLSILTDSYKATHLLMYQPAQEMRAYGEFRQAYPKVAPGDDRIVVYGIRYYLDNFINRIMDNDDILRGQSFLKDHLLTPLVANPALIPLRTVKEGQLGYFDPRPGFDLNSAKEDELTYFDLIAKNNYRFPVKIEAMPEGSVIRPHVPAFIITAKQEYSRMCTFLETILTMIWYPSCVATLSRHTKALIVSAFERSVDPGPMYDIKLNSRLHDFGFRGCTCVEQSVIGGSAHLLSFDGSDTMSACYYVREILNGGVNVGVSIAATEHSVMTSWETEMAAIRNACEKFQNGMIACVLDAYDYDFMMTQGLKEIAPIVKKYNNEFIIRPDSGDPVEQVLKALKNAEGPFGYDLNSKGFKVLRNVSVIQGDGIDYQVVNDILEAVLENKYAASNVAFGMGGGLLQKVNRDTMSFATKLCHMTDKTGNSIDVLKRPKDNPEKMSLGGKLVVLHKVLDNGNMDKHFVCSEEDAESYLTGKRGGTYRRSMRVVYDGTDTSGQSASDIEAFKNEKFHQIRERLNKEWNFFAPPLPAVDDGLRRRQKKGAASIGRKIDLMKQAALGSSIDAHAVGTDQAVELKSDFNETGNIILRALDKML